MVVPDSGKKEEVLNLMKEKDKIEQSIRELGNVLSANMVGMNDSLVDESGFPRNDIDVYQVRHARQQIICLQNDLKQKMKEIENGLEVIHTEARLAGVCTTTRKMAIDGDNTQFMEVDNESTVNRQNMKSIVKVNLVSPTSPAETAGLKVDDEILEFGTINSTNFKDLTQIGEIVKHRENNEIKLSVKRNGADISLSLVPKKWSGRGLLGCNIILV